MDNKINKALMMSEKEYIKSQQNIIESFFKEYFTYDISNVGCWLMTGIFTFIQLIFFAMPAQLLAEDGINYEFLAFMAMPIAFSVFFYIQPYMVGNVEGKAGEDIYSRIKYLPVSLKSIRIFRCKKMMKFVLKIFLISVVLQIGTTLLKCHCITLQNVLFLLIYGLLIPFFTGICAAMR